MGLRIGSSGESTLSVLRSLRRSSIQESRSLERIASGRKINRASDGPAAAVLIERLSAEIASLGQASRNTQSAANLVNTAESGLAEVSDQLNGLRTQALAALNSGIFGSDIQNTIQGTVDQSVAAITRLSNSTRFGSRDLLNGELSLQTGAASSELERIDVQSGDFSSGFPRTVSVEVTDAATQATAGGTVAATQTGASVVRITGSGGSVELSFAAGASREDIVAAINTVSEQTGVEAAVTGEIRSVEFGSNESIQIEEISGDLEGIAAGVSSGTDVVANVDGQVAQGVGNVVQLRTSGLSADIQVEAGATGNFDFTVEGGGATFQLGTTSADSLTVGIASADAATLGRSSGLGGLTSITSGGANSLANDPRNALRVIDAASSEILGQRSRLGSLRKNILDSGQRSIDSQIENVTASRSRLADADIASEIANSVRSRILRQSSVSALAQLNLNSASALRLLGG